MSDDPKRRTYQTWSGMKQRCYNPKCQNYPNYGARGIVVCDRWRNSFTSFLEDMGTRPIGLTLERKDNNGNYEKDNCTWADRATQQRNQRRNHHVMVDGVALTLTEWAVREGIPPPTVIDRFRKGIRGNDLIAPASQPSTAQDMADRLRIGRRTENNQTAKTHCPAGHEYSMQNTVVATKKGHSFRLCRICARVSKVKSVAKRRTAMASEEGK